MADSHCTSVPATASLAEEPQRQAAAGDTAARVRSLVEAHYDFAWRTLRYLGFSPTDAEDGAQQVMCVLARRIDDVRPGAERPFLFSTAMRVAALMRRTARRRPESFEPDFDALAAPTPGADAQLDQQEAHALLQRVLEAIPIEQRLVFVLFEIEEMTMPEIAAALRLPPGTVASRLRRGRESFQAIVKRMQAAQRARGEGP